MIQVLGGPADFLSRPDEYLPAAPVIRPVFAEGDGIIAAIDTRAIGLAVVSLGGGRTRVGEAIDPAVGFSALAGIGASARAPLGLVHARDQNAADRATAALRAAYRIADTAPAASSLVRARLPYRETA